ncbi:MAG: 50S ribosomal protein L24 [Candidatus Edwardsbacteria bacterium]
MKIVKGDQVKVTAGDDRGKVGKVLKIFPPKNRAIVEGINFVKRHTRAVRQAQQGGILTKESPIHLSNLVLICPKCGKTTRVGRIILAHGRKARTCKQCGEILEKEK